GCSMVGCVGADGVGVELRAELVRAGIADGGLVTVPNRPTTVKTRVLVRHQQVARYDHEVEDDVPEAIAEQLCNVIESSTPEVDVVVLQDYNKGVLAPAVIRATLATAHRHRRPVVVDPKARAFFDYAGATVF